MTWETPSYVEVNMSAEIGGYQDEFKERTPPPSDPLQHEILPLGSDKNA